jgi:ABC-type transport system involved in multi-copper enzyme maturation permease subunit
MRSLIWKDCRLNSWVLMLGVATWLGPYIAGVLWLLLGAWPTVASGLRWAFMLAPASVVSLELTILPLLLLGANAIARERADRSAEFLACLPLSRTKIIASKAAVPLAFASLVWTSHLLAASVVVPALSNGREGLPPGLSRAVVAAEVFLFGTAWLGSSIVDTPLKAVGLGMGMYLLVGMLGTQASDYLLGWQADRLNGGAASAWHAGADAIVGITCFVGGTWNYLRRVEP